IIPGNKLNFISPTGRRLVRAMSGKFKALRWHLCLTAKPRLWPIPVYRIHANVVLTRDGKTPLPGDKTHQRRRRLTKSWWNDVWRDRLVAGMSFLGQNKCSISMETGDAQFAVA